MATITQKVTRKLTRLFQKDYVQYNDMILPAKEFRVCDLKYQDDQYFLSSAQKEADRLVNFCGLKVESHVLDVGCGMGRLPIGILSRVGEIEHYRGVDVSRRSIQWCQSYITSRHPTFQFFHVDVENSRYNPGGNSIDDFRFDFHNQEFDIIFLYSVFSHTSERDVRIYLKEFQRLLAPDGTLFLTGFIEEGVPKMTVNPDNYNLDWSGPLHCVRYDKAFFEALLDEYGFYINRFDYATGDDGQSSVYLSRRKERYI